MDSFYDEQPRSVPKPITFDQVPSCELTSENNCYNAWKAKVIQSFTSRKLKGDKQAITLNSEVGLEKGPSSKHVRFDSPHIQKCILNRDKRSIKPTFKDIDKENIPNRCLDLSILDNMPRQPAEKSDLQRNIGKFPKSNFNEKYNEKNFNPELKNYYTTDYTDYYITKHQTQKSSPNKKTNYNLPSSLPVSQFDNIRQIGNNSGSVEPTITELLKVIQQQNEQILLLQKQVASLIENQVAERMQNTLPTYVSQQRITRQEFARAQFNQHHSTKRALPQLAVNVMTSFEVSACPSQTAVNSKCNAEEVITQAMQVQKMNFEQGKRKLNSNNEKQDDKEEILQKQSQNLSLSLNEPLMVVEQCPSRENSIHVDMRDYSSDDDESTVSSSGDLGWTIYNNVMGQVSNMLKNAEGVKNTDTGLNTAETLDNRTLRRVQEATIRHLKRIGVNLATEECYDLKCLNDDVPNNSVYSPTEISFAVKQLLMKYLPNDQLMKLTQLDLNQTKTTPFECRKEDSFTRRRPEFSFATIQYMKKYNLLTSDSMLPPQTTQSNKKWTNDPLKILDVTVLKQQPKLL
ncbi:hypothetical protein AMK59_7005 [Oryctes borbonicus]|uniref:Uncharacterized protein n=1 Tax=Oryctes borbonicus TaxID=1629725 RepID=A0A0T6B076_9SCAR|nr:hypothetical protein AMK59_7005 [Oryctes borbonicus]